MQEDQEKEVRETSQRMDINSKVIFGNNKLCAQFLNDYVDIPLLKNIRPEDIEDVKERHHFFDDVELNSDTVKRIRVKSHAGNKSTAGDGDSETEESIYLVSLIDHKSQVDSAKNMLDSIFLTRLFERRTFSSSLKYIRWQTQIGDLRRPVAQTLRNKDYDVSMQLLRYMVCIWYNWEKEQVSKGKHRHKDYRYPPILPIIYYEGKGKWTAGYHLRDRILLYEYFADYIPDFRYQVIRVQDYDNRELLQKKDEISLLMLINKIQNVDDMKSFTDISPEELDAIAGQADEDVLNIISAVVQGLCRKLNLPDDETAEYVGKVKERNMGYLFENMEKMDIQAERRNTARERARADEAEQKIHYKKAFGFDISESFFCE